MKRLTMNRYKRAKKKWFEQNVIEFEIMDFDAITNTCIVEYNAFTGLRLQYPTYNPEAKELFLAICKMPAWQIYFKFRLKLKQRYPGERCLVFNEIRKKNIW